MQLKRTSENKRRGRGIKKARISNFEEDDSFSDQKNLHTGISATKLIDEETNIDIENSSETDSEQIDKETLLKLKKILIHEYWEVRKKYEKRIRMFGQNIFLKNSGKKIEPKKLTPIAFDMEEHSQTNYEIVQLKSNTISSHVQKCLLIPLEVVYPVPTMQYWTLTEVNVLADDEYTLSHIPFLGDHEDDQPFCSDLLETFPEGIHGTKLGCGEYINDFILYYTIKAVKVKCPPTSESTIFKCTYHYFPNKSSTNELSSLFPDLQQRFEPESIEKQELTNEFGEFLANLSYSRLLNSYEVLICHKCFSYDCIMHDATVANRFSGALRSKRRQRFNTARKDIETEKGIPCSKMCYKHKLEARPKPKADLHSSQHRKLSIEVDNIKKTSSWTPHEESVFNLLRSTEENDFCKIAFFLNHCSRNTKTCYDVYEYSIRNAPISPRLSMNIQSPKKSKKMRDNHRSFRAMKWAHTNGKVENTGRYVPCKHKGSCKEAPECGCVKANNLCTKYCACIEECANRFPGCRCAPGNCRTKQCQCYFASWECDPDICLNCNCGKLDNSKEQICKNISIQRGLQKKLIVAPSQVAGWGCFSNEEIEKNDFISEYCGEVITQAESERRGKIYDKIKCSYLFGLNEDQVVDATRIGNVIRFANHSTNPNCRAKVIVVNGDHKIGIFAQRHIKAGEELFFNYAYNKSQQIEFVPKELSLIQKHRTKSLESN